MKGTRPLTTEEIIKVSQQFDGEFAIRNRSLFMLGVSVGGRISELLALKIGDVYQNGKAVSDLLFERDMVKGKETARMIPVNEDGQTAVRELIEWHKEKYGNLNPKRPLFPSRKHGSNELRSFALSRSQAHRILERAFQQAGLNGKLATHSLRKTYAQRMYDATGDIYLVREMLGHKDVKTTQEYLGVSYAKAQLASKAIELNNRNAVLLHSPAKMSTADLIVELQARGVDMTSAIRQMQAKRLRLHAKTIRLQLPKGKIAEVKGKSVSLLLTEVIQQVSEGGVEDESKTSENVCFIRKPGSF